jgi:hypothetical protein
MTVGAASRHLPPRVHGVRTTADGGSPHARKGDDMTPITSPAWATATDEPVRTCSVHAESLALARERLRQLAVFEERLRGLLATRPPRGGGSTSLRWLTSCTRAHPSASARRWGSMRRGCGAGCSGCVGRDARARTRS